jgi:phosphoribosyl-ATP pyrophosphohydrolase
MSCFHQFVYEDIESAPRIGLGRQLEKLYDVIQSRKQERPEGSYTSYLFDEGLDKILKKLGEETTETIVAAKNVDHQRFVGEVSDLIYHLLVLLVERDTRLTEISAELARRHEVSTTSR